MTLIGTAVGLQRETHYTTGTVSVCWCASTFVLYTCWMCVFVCMFSTMVCVCVCESLGVLCNNLQASQGHLVHCQPLSLWGVPRIYPVETPVKTNQRFIDGHFSAYRDSIAFSPYSSPFMKTMTGLSPQCYPLYLSQHMSRVNIWALQTLQGDWGGAIAQYFS